MSTFFGRMNEYPEISIDRFDGRNLESLQYFLSHKHADHTVGLSSDRLAYRLTSNHQIRLYCSPVTKQLLLMDKKFAHLSPFIVALEIGESNVIRIPDPCTGKTQLEVTVTLLSAAHCPGSVMFLFEGSRGNVLYTGDFRLGLDDIQSMAALHQAEGKPKELRSAYVDTTFCIPQAIYIPSRQESVASIIDIIAEWLNESPQNVALIHHKANLGYEHLFVEISRHFSMPVHVDDARFEQYEQIAYLSDHTTDDPTSTRIHACRAKRRRQELDRELPCGHSAGPDMRVRTITVSTMCFVQHVGVSAFTKRYSETYFRACYSFHSSYTEIREMILYLKPKRAFANVAPDPKIQKTLSGFVDASHKSNVGQEESSNLGQLRKKSRLKKASEGSYSEADSSLDFGDSPVKVRTRSSGSPCKAKISSLTTAKQIHLSSAAADSSDEGEGQIPDKYDHNNKDHADDDYSSQSDVDLFDDGSWIQRASQDCSVLGKVSSQSQDVEEFGEYCSLVIDEGDEEGEDVDESDHGDGCHGDSGRSQPCKDSQGSGLSLSQNSDRTLPCSPIFTSPPKAPVTIDLTAQSSSEHSSQNDCDLVIGSVPNSDHPGLKRSCEFSETKFKRNKTDQQSHEVIDISSSPDF